MSSRKMNPAAGANNPLLTTSTITFLASWRGQLLICTVTLALGAIYLVVRRPISAILRKRQEALSRARQAELELMEAEKPKQDVALDSTAAGTGKDKKKRKGAAAGSHLKLGVLAGSGTDGQSSRDSSPAPSSAHLLPPKARQTSRQRSVSPSSASASTSPAPSPKPQIRIRQPTAEKVDRLPTIPSSGESPNTPTSAASTTGDKMENGMHEWGSVAAGKSGKKDKGRSPANPATSSSSRSETRPEYIPLPSSPESGPSRRNSHDAGGGDVSDATTNSSMQPQPSRKSFSDGFSIMPDASYLPPPIPAYNKKQKKRRDKQQQMDPLFDTTSLSQSSERYSIPTSISVGTSRSRSPPLTPTSGGKARGHARKASLKSYRPGPNATPAEIDAILDERDQIIDQLRADVGSVKVQETQARDGEQQAKRSVKEVQRELEVVRLDADKANKEHQAIETQIIKHYDEVYAVAKHYDEMMNQHGDAFRAHGIPCECMPLPEYHSFSAFQPPIYHPGALPPPHLAPHQQQQQRQQQQQFAPGHQQFMGGKAVQYPGQHQGPHPPHFQQQQQQQQQPNGFHPYPNMGMGMPSPGPGQPQYGMASPAPHQYQHQQHIPPPHSPFMQYAPDSLSPQNHMMPNGYPSPMPMPMQAQMPLQMAPQGYMPMPMSHPGSPYASARPPSHMMGGYPSPGPQFNGMLHPHPHMPSPAFRRVSENGLSDVFAGPLSPGIGPPPRSPVFNPAHMGLGVPSDFHSMTNGSSHSTSSTDSMTAEQRRASIAASVMKQKPDHPGASSDAPAPAPVEPDTVAEAMHGLGLGAVNGDESKAAPVVNGSSGLTEAIARVDSQTSVSSRSTPSSADHSSRDASSIHLNRKVLAEHEQDAADNNAPIAHERCIKKLAGSASDGLLRSKSQEQALAALRYEAYAAEAAAQPSPKPLFEPDSLYDTTYAFYPSMDRTTEENQQEAAKLEAMREAAFLQRQKAKEAEVAKFAEMRNAALARKQQKQKGDDSKGFAIGDGE